MADPEDPLERALAYALRQLNRRERTTGEIRAHLERKEIDPAVAEEAIELLAQDGYLNDVRYAELFAQDKRELEQWGAERIQRTLLGRGLDRELVERTIAAQEQGGAETELERAVALLRRRFPTPPGERRDRDRALGVLIRKGYDPDLALDALALYARERAPSARA